MNKTVIKKALIRQAGGAQFVNREQIKACMGWGNGRTDKLIEGLDFIRLNRTKQYFAEEVADRILEQVSS